MTAFNRLAPSKIIKGERCLLGRFQAMGCSCEILMDTDDTTLAERLLDIAETEARRVEFKWSRYRPDNIVHTINTSGGRPVRVDAETAHLFDFAARAYHLSQGLFDITSGVLRKAWTFAGGENQPSASDVEGLLPLVGWDKVSWDGAVIRLPRGMEIDLGGIGKEYAVDRVLNLLRNETEIAVLVNFGGDVAATSIRKDSQPWYIGIEKPDNEGTAIRVLQLREGALATSGDTKRFVMVEGKRLGHILDPRTGWPVANAPRSVTTAAPTCSEAGFFSTLGILSGSAAAAILTQAGVRHWIY